MEDEYVHGYSEIESDRLVDQANTLANLLHNDTVYSAGSKVLEAGCGVGAQTLMLATNSPDAQIKSVDISEESVNRAKLLLKQHGVSNVEFEVADIFNLPFEAETFDHIFVCFVLEHLKDPVAALEGLRRVLKGVVPSQSSKVIMAPVIFILKQRKLLRHGNVLLNAKLGLTAIP